ncbi:MAG TPA: hypothetical protein VLH56_02970 [Dissulfurispiraceae bacterium]|nr:hypothetical protein [Dissulfurispiraceae bacterium]
MSVLSAGVPEADVIGALPDFTRKFLHTVQNFSIQFYRDIHSHDSSGFPAAKEVFFYLLFFVVEHRIQCERAPNVAERLLEHMNMLLTDAMSGNGSAFHAEAFWSVYRERATAYVSEHEFPLVREKLLDVFTAQLLARLHDWPKLITYHGAAVAGEALEELDGAFDGS